jgi:hypothetical protein
MLSKILAVLILSAAAVAQINNGGGGSGSTAYPAITSGTNANALVTGTGGTNSPSGTGQIAASADWIQNGPGVISPNAPTLAFAVGGGALNNVTVHVKLTFVGAAVIEPSGEVKIALTGCSSNCTVTVTMPASCTSPTAPVTGCTVWDTISGTGTEKQQAASPNCVNITTATCVISTIGAGATLTTPTTTGIVPTGAQTNTCPDNIIPTNWYQGADANYYPLAGIDISALNGKTTPPGVFTFCNSVFFNDTSGPPVISNALVSIHHQSGNTTSVGTGFDDRAFAIEMIDTSTSFSGTPGQSLTQYNERIVTNNAWSCNSVNKGKGAGESCAAAGRFVTSDLRTASAGSANMVGVAGVASTNATPVVLTGAVPGVIGVVGGAYQGTAANPNGNGNIYSGGLFQSDGAAGNTNGSGYAIYVQNPSTARFATTNRGLYIQDFGTNTADWNIYSEGTAGTPTSGRNYFKANVYLPNIFSNTNTAIAITGSVAPQGSVQTTQLATPGQPGAISNVGTPGSTSYTYAVVCKDAMGNTTAGGTTRNTATGNATLDGTNKNQFQFFVPVGSTGCDVYRTASSGTPSSTGKIGNVTTNDTVNQAAAGTVFADTGLAGDNTVMPAVNTTGGANFAGIVQTPANVVSVASDVVFNADTALHNITGLSWNIGVLAGTYVFDCTIVYSQATAAVANAFGIQATLTSPTNIEADGMVFTNTTAVTSGVLATLTTTTATNIVSFTPGATATNFIAKLHGQIIEPANTGGNTINIMALTGAAADALTIRKGSSCQLN